MRDVAGGADFASLPRDPAISEKEVMAMRTALAMESLRLTMAQNYSIFLEKLVFTCSPELDDKTILSYQRTLDTDEAHMVLAIIWRATSPELAEAGLSRSQKRPTCHGLAVELAIHPNEVAATNTRIRTIGIAAQAYGLLHRTCGQRNKVPLQSTALLHSLMIQLGEEHRLASDKFLSPLRFDPPLAGKASDGGTPR